jgi:hypothetical protein
MDLAEEVLASFYQARDAIASIRNPIGWMSEGKSRPREKAETPEQTEARDRAYAFYERYDRHSELFGRLHALRYRFEANFGSDAAKPFQDINKAVNRVLNAARELARLWAEPGRTRDGTIEHLENRVWAHGEKDEIQQEVNEAVEKIEGICKPLLLRK